MKLHVSRQLRICAIVLALPTLYVGSYPYLRLSGLICKYPTDNHGAWHIEAARPVPVFSLWIPTQKDLDAIERQRRLAPLLDVFYRPIRDLELLYANAYDPPDPWPKADAAAVRAGVCQKAHRDLHAACGSYHRANGRWPTNTHELTIFAEKNQFPLKLEFLGALVLEIDGKGSLIITHEGPDGRGIAELSKEFPFSAEDNMGN
jgi:hypothetical protein